MSTEADITGHYSSGELLQRLSAVLTDDGADPQAPTIAAMAPYDQFHGRGMEATEELAGCSMPLQATMCSMSAAASAGRRATWPTGSAARSRASI